MSFLNEINLTGLFVMSISLVIGYLFSVFINSKVVNKYVNLYKEAKIEIDRHKLNVNNVLNINKERQAKILELMNEKEALELTIEKMEDEAATLNDKIAMLEEKIELNKKEIALIKSS